jgi:hypothetical protein
MASDASRETRSEESIDVLIDVFIDVLDVALVSVVAPASAANTRMIMARIRFPDKSRLGCTVVTPPATFS